MRKNHWKEVRSLLQRNKALAGEAEQLRVAEEKAKMQLKVRPGLLSTGLLCQCALGSRSV